MKKLISLMGALAFGATAFAQVSKTDTTNKTVTRKVLPSDITNLPPSTDANSKNGIKGTVTQKGRENSMAPFEKQHYTQKLSNANNRAVADSATTPAEKKAKVPSQKN